MYADEDSDWQTGLRTLQQPWPQDCLGFTSYVFSADWISSSNLFPPAYWVCGAGAWGSGFQSVQGLGVWGSKLGSASLSADDSLTCLFREAVLGLVCTCDIFGIYIYA